MGHAVTGAHGWQAYVDARRGVSRSPRPSADARIEAAARAGHDIAAQVRRRRAASARLDLLPGVPADPVLRCEPGRLTAARLDGSRAAWHHLRSLGLVDHEHHVEHVLRECAGLLPGGRRD